MKTIKFTLNKEQKKHLKSIEWLLSKEAKTGRSYLLAFIYINKALNNEQVKIIDHTYINCGGLKYNKMLADMIQEIITKHNIPVKIVWDSLILKKKK